MDDLTRVATITVPSFGALEIETRSTKLDCIGMRIPMRVLGLRCKPCLHTDPSTEGKRFLVGGIEERTRR